MRLTEIQAALREEGLDGWLFFDHHKRDPLAYRVLQFTPGSMVTAMPGDNVRVSRRNG